MWAKHKRSFFKKLPYIIFTIIFLTILFSGIFYLTKIFIYKTTSYISPLAQTKIYKDNSIESILFKNNIPFSRLKIASDSSYIVFLNDGGEVDMLPENIQRQISSLQLILSRLTIEGKKFKRLDLRFDKPIIVF